MIQISKKIRIKEAAEILGVTPQTLRNWEKSNKIKSHRSPGGQRYFDLQEIEHLKIDLEVLGWAWASSAQAPDLPLEYYCERQDRFQSRLERMMSEFLEYPKEIPMDLVSLLGLIVGEIGDNSFAHNLGNWPDIPGIFYGYNINKRLIVLADRGRGIKETLRNVRPEITSDIEALKIAFTEIVSGRNPEKRGNGLKVVRKVVESNNLDLLFLSGIGSLKIPKETQKMFIEMNDQNVRGVYAVIKF